MRASCFGIWRQRLSSKDTIAESRVGKDRRDHEHRTHDEERFASGRGGGLGRGKVKRHHPREHANRQSTQNEANCQNTPKLATMKSTNARTFTGAFRLLAKTAYMAIGGRT